MDMGKFFQNAWNGACNAAKNTWDWTCSHSKELAQDACKIGFGVAIIGAGIALASEVSDDDSEEEDITVEIED